MKLHQCLQVSLLFHKFRGHLIHYLCSRYKIWTVYVGVSNRLILILIFPVLLICILIRFRPTTPPMGTQLLTLYLKVPLYCSHCCHSNSTKSNIFPQTNFKQMFKVLILYCSNGNGKFRNISKHVNKIDVKKCINRETLPQHHFFLERDNFRNFSDILGQSLQCNEPYLKCQC